jgi:hypothetical protein
MFGFLRSVLSVAEAEATEEQVQQTSEAQPVAYSVAEVRAFGVQK